MSHRFAQTTPPRGNPFWLDWIADQLTNAADFQLHWVTSLPGPILRDWMLEAGFDGDYAPPSFENSDSLQMWSDWWQEVLDGRWIWNAKHHRYDPLKKP